MGALRKITDEFPAVLQKYLDSGLLTASIINSPKGGGRRSFPTRRIQKKPLRSLTRITA
jgi:hypothetical protein